MSVEPTPFDVYSKIQADAIFAAKQAQIDGLATEVGTNTSGVSINAGAIATEVQDRIDADQALQDQIDAIPGGGGGGGGGSEIITVEITLEDIDSGEERTGVVTFGSLYSLLKVEADGDCRIRLYVNEDLADADAARSILEFPSGEHGVVFDAGITIEAGGVLHATSVIGWSEGSNDVPYRIANLGADTIDLTVGFTVEKRMELP